MRVRSLGRFPWRRAWQPTLVFMPREYHGQRSLVGYSPRGHTESDTTEATQNTHTSLPLESPSHPAILPLQVVTEPQAELSMLYSSFSLAICFTRVVYTCQYYSPNLSLPPMSTGPFSTSVSLLLPCRQVHLYHFCRFHIYVLIYICFSPSDLFHFI